MCIPHAKNQQQHTVLHPPYERTKGRGVGLVANSWMDGCMATAARRLYGTCTNNHPLPPFSLPPQTDNGLEKWLKAAEFLLLSLRGREKQSKLNFSSSSSTHTTFSLLLQATSCLLIDRPLLLQLSSEEVQAPPQQCDGDLI